MPDFYYDCETRSAADLKVVGAHVYAANVTTEVLCVGFAVDDGPVEIWTPGQPIPEPAIEAARNPDWRAIAHNAGFDRQIVERILHPQFGWPLVPPERHRCTMAKALAAALPGALGKAIEALGLAHPKDKAGAVLMRRMAKPKRGGGWIDDPASLERLKEYVRRDMEAMRALDRAIPSLTEDEQCLWTLDAIVNSRGFHTDGALLEAAHQVVTATEAKSQSEFQEVTGLDSTNQTAKLIAWLAERGCIVTDVQKGTLRHALRRKELIPEVRRAIELRLELAHASAAKVEALRAWRGLDGRVRGTLRFHGAATGRWSGSGPQPQNFKRDSENIEAKIAAVMNGGAGLTSPVEAVGDIARAMITAAPGHRLLIGDLSGIESRGLAWASRQQSKLDAWAQFDRSGDPNDDPYLIIGRSLGHPEATARAMGKIADLAFGYQGGVGAWQNFAPEDDASDEATIKRNRDTWRRQHPATERFWYALDRAAVRAVAKPATDQRCDRFVFRFDAPFLRISLPSGRSLSYPFPRIEVGKFGSQLVMFLDNAGGKFVDCRFGHGSYGGLWTENIVSAIARDLLAAALTRLEAAGYPVVLHVHDEIVAEVPDGFGSVEEFKHILCEVPAWAEGLPIAAKVRNGPRFSKAEKEEVPQSPTPAENAPAANCGAGFIRTDPESTAPPPSKGTPWDDPLGDIYTDAATEVPPPPRDGAHEPGGTEGAKHERKTNGYAHGSKAKAKADTYAEEHAGEPFSDVYLRNLGYQLARVFDYTLPDAALLYQQNRYELHPKLSPTKKRPRKRFLPHRIVNGKDIFGAGDRLVIYNWPAIMRAGPGSNIHVTEGESNAKVLIDAGLLATTVLSHKWTPECVAALTGHHLIIHQDHDKDGEKLADAARQKLARVAASTRIVPASHLWKHLPAGCRAIKPHDDVKDWLEIGGDPTKLLDICCEIPADGILESVRAADEEIEDYEWIWPGRFALKKIGLIVGLPDEGKGLALSDIMARITRGAPWPCGEGHAPLGNVILLSAEDDISDTIIPRLMAAGADLNRITILKMMREAGQERMFSLVTDLHALRQKAVEVGNVKAIIIDPISAYLGIGKVDSYRATDVRAVLSPLKELTSELRTLVLGIMHFNKKTDVTNVLLRISDSLAYGAASRHVYGIINDPDNHRKLFVKGKNNLAPAEQKTLAFSFDEREVGISKTTGLPIRRPYIVWEPDPVDITASEALQAAAESNSPGKRDNAKHFLTTLLSNGPMGSKEVLDAAKANGISFRTLYRAKDELAVEIRKDGPLNEKGERTWQWHPPTK
jgi:DNA polymerase